MPESHPARISVVIPTCNREQLALEAIESIVRNDYPDFEVLVVDQGPKDVFLKAIVNRFPDDQRIRYFHLDYASASAARNVGLDNSTGEIVMFLDDDAVADPGCLQGYATAFSAIVPPPGLVAGRLLPLWGAPKPSWYPESRQYMLGLYSPEGGLAPMPPLDLPVSANFAVLASVANSVARFDERLGFSYSRPASMLAGEDSVYGMNIRKAGYQMYHQPAASAHHRIAPYKLRPWYFLRRNFWEGVTTLTVLYMTGSITDEGVKGAVKWHAKEMCRHVARLFINRSQRMLFISPTEWMNALAGCSHSLGIIYASNQWKKHGTLPWDQGSRATAAHDLAGNRISGKAE